MKLTKIIGVAAIALALVSCKFSGSYLDGDALAAAAVTGGNGGSTDNGTVDTPATTALSNIRYAIGKDVSVVSEANKANWNPARVEANEYVIVGFDVNKEGDIAEVVYQECIGGEVIWELNLADWGGNPNVPYGRQEGENGAYVEGYGRVGNSLCVMTTMSSGTGDLSYNFIVTFEDGTVETIASSPFYVTKLSNIRIAKGRTDAAVAEANKANWNPGTAKLNEYYMVGFDVNTDEKITGVLYQEIIEGSLAYEADLIKKWNADPNKAYGKQGNGGLEMDGFGLSGETLCLNVILDNGDGDTTFKFIITFESGVVETIVSAPVTVLPPDC